MLGLPYAFQSEGSLDPLLFNKNARWTSWGGEGVRIKIWGQNTPISRSKKAVYNVQVKYSYLVWILLGYFIMTTFWPWLWHCNHRMTLLRAYCNTIYILFPPTHTHIDGSMREVVLSSNLVLPSLRWSILIRVAISNLLNNGMPTLTIVRLTWKIKLAKNASFTFAKLYNVP